jgi:hypothetical protein
MVGNSSGFGCRFLKNSQPWRGLAGVEYFAIRSFHQPAELVRQGGDSGKALQKIQGNSFAFEQGSGAAGYVGYAISFVEMISVLAEDFETTDAPSNFVDYREDFASGQDQRFSRQEVSRGLTILGYAGLRSDIAPSYVFLKGLPDNVNNLRGHSVWPVEFRIQLTWL